MKKQDQKVALKASGHAMRDLVAYLSRFRGPLILAITFAIAGSLINVYGPSKLSDITNLITSGLKGPMPLKEIAKQGLFLIIIYGVASLCNFVQSWQMSTISQRLPQSLRHDISAKIDRLPLRYFDNHATGDTLSRVTNDADTIGQMMNQSISNTISSLAMMFGVIIMMLITNWLLALAGMVTAILGFFTSSRLLASSQAYYNNQQAALGDINGKIEESYSGIATIKAYNAEKEINQNFNEVNDRLYTYAWKSTTISGAMNPLSQFFGNAAYVVVCVLGAILAQQGTITFGVIVAFMIYIRLFAETLQNMGQLASSIEMLTAASKRIFDFLQEKEMEPETGKEELTKVTGTVDFNHVKFGYDYPDQVIIKDFTCHVQPGQKIALVGPTGAGKTTIVNLLMRFYEVNGGSIKIDGHAIKDLTRANVRQLFGMVLQDTWLFDGTLRENLVYNQENVSQELLDEVCQDTGLSDLVEQLPKGYDTEINANDLSSGQKQLITIARAMIKDAPLLILDEATSNVDTRTELKVQAAMDKLMKGRTSFVIAHRLSTIKNADQILVINHGDVIETGTHEELLTKGGFYADLYNSQFDNA